MSKQRHKVGVVYFTKPIDRSGMKPIRTLSERHLGIAAFVIAAVSTSWLMLQRPNFLMGYDYVRMHFFYKTYFREAVLSGRFPFWNPYSGLGRPFLSDIETQALYPPNLLVLPLGVAGGVVASIFLHQALAVYGGTKLGALLGADRIPSLALGTGFALAGPFVARLASGMVPVYCLTCWWPVILWLGASLQDRATPRAMVGFAAATCFAILAGNPPILFVEFLALAIFLAGRISWPETPEEFREALLNLSCLAVAFALGVGLAGVQLAPFIELIGQGNRPLYNPSFATANGMSPASWLSLIHPASPEFRPNWEYDLYSGLIPLFAAPGALLFWRDRNVRALLLLGVIGGLLAAGDHAPILGWFVRVMPGAGALRFPARYGLCVSASLLGLAAISLSRPSQLNSVLVLAMAAVAVCWTMWLRPYVVHEAGGVFNYYSDHIGAIAESAIALVGWNLEIRNPSQDRARSVLIAVLVFASWCHAVHLLSPIYSRYGFETHETSVSRELKAAGLLDPGTPPPRFSSNRASMSENAGMTIGYSSISSYSNPQLERVWNQLHETTKTRPSDSDFILLPGPVTDKPDQLRGMNIVADLDPVTKVTKIHAPMGPRAFLSFKSVAVPDPKAATALEASGLGSPDVAVFEPGYPQPVPSTAPPGAQVCKITSFAPERVVVQASSPRPATLVIAEAWYPGWEASINGSKATVFPVNNWMRGVVVPEGESTVVFTYSPGIGGLWISLVSAFALLFSARFLARRQATAAIALVAQ